MTEHVSIQIADLRNPPARPWAWLRRNPVVVDALVVILACGPHLAALRFRDDDPSWWGYPLVAVTAAALFLRRRWPLAMLTVVALACAFSPLARPGAGFPMIPFAFALYTVASRQSAGRAVVAYGIGTVAAVFATIPYSLSGVTPPLVALLDPFALIALVVGLIVKNRRDQEQRVLELVNERIEHAALTERTRIAAEMHDVVAHALTVIVSLANGATRIRIKDPEKADAAVDQIAAVSRDALEDMHRTLDMLRSADADLDANLHHSGDNLPTLDELVDRFRTAGLPVTLARNGEPLPDDVGVRQAVFRIVQESLTNTLRHADSPSSAAVTIGHDGSSVEIRVEDDGLPRSTRHVPGHGFVGVEQRCRAFGGHAESGPRASGGWRTVAVLHVRPHGERGRDD
ncbi:histidine kinase [Agromyces atrinae]|uniref:sensor histidine kinase n=1 Tax=Agromyces atrinae TaxID=592376 RepID=UPI001F57A380|nr:histidine kinase [Agromyces atrinae]MCI2958449.1 histidine kinase [Agromyces atrinae]